MRRYVLVFGIAYLVLTVALAVLGEVLEVGAAVGLNIAATLGASFFAAARFAKELGRSPTSGEVGSFSWWGLLAVWVVSLTLVLVAIPLVSSGAELGAMVKALASPMILAFVLVGGIILSAIYFFALKWSFSWYAKRAIRA
jgi:hypothetical protein